METRTPACWVTANRADRYTMATVVRQRGIEPLTPPWEGGTLPLRHYRWCRLRDLNPWPHRCGRCALPAELNLLCPNTNPVWFICFSVPPAKSRRLAVAIRAEHLKVLQPVVTPVAVLVVQFQGYRLTIPLWTETTTRASVFQQSFPDQPLLYPSPVDRPDGYCQELLERSRLPSPESIL